MKTPLFRVLPIDLKIPFGSHFVPAPGGPNFLCVKSLISQVHRPKYPRLARSY